MIPDGMVGRSGTESFFAYARKRYQLMLDRTSGFPPPWTDDPILRDYRFCNVFREDDKTTKFIREHVPHKGYGLRYLGALVIARWFNRIETIERLLPPDGTSPPYFEQNLLFRWDPQHDGLDAWESAVRERLAGVKPLVTGAYMIKTPAGMDKLSGLLWCLRQFLPHAIHLQVHIDEETTLEGVWERLREFPYLGDFMAYEIVTDLRHTLMKTAPDINTWANPGPGCARGIDRLLGLPVGTLKRHQKVDREKMMGVMQNLLASSRNDKHWPARWPKWEMREVEHTLCEFDKYERALFGQGTPKQKYNGKGC